MTKLHDDNITIPGGGGAAMPSNAIVTFNTKTIFINDRDVTIQNETINGKGLKILAQKIDLDEWDAWKKEPHKDPFFIPDDGVVSIKDGDVFFVELKVTE
jgi:hypothetical protein